nr:peptidylprolyl isomerase [Cyclobacteriaceae bacterium]
EKVSSLQGSLEEIATAFGKDANVYTNSSLRMNANTLASAGFEPVAIGMAFSLESGKRSKPYAGENGVIIIETQVITTAPASADYSIYKSTLQQAGVNRNSASITEAIKLDASIEDKRYRFY